MTDAFGNWMGKFVDGVLEPVVDYGNAWSKVNDVTKDALDRFGVTPFLESAFGNPLTVMDFWDDSRDFNYSTDTVLGQAGTAFLGGDQSVMDAILNGTFDYSGFISSLTSSGKLGASGLGQPVNPVNNNNASGVGGSSISPSVNNYFNAELASFYGMDRNTAYQEALANTAYRRAVKDMQAAGLNPASIFGAGRGSTAGGVAFIGNSNSASGYGSGSGSSSNSKLFERDTYGMIAALTGLATAFITKRPQNFWLGQQAAQGIMQTLNVLDRKYNR